MSEIEGIEEQILQATPEDHTRWALEEHIETLKIELQHTKQREREARIEAERRHIEVLELVGQLANKRRWW